MAENENKPQEPSPLASPDAGDAPAKPKSSPKGSSGKKLLFMLVGIAVVAFVIALAGSEYFASRSVKTSDTGMPTDGAPTVGGPFTLVNQNGEEVSDTDFRGQNMLIFFGYTYCPDVCPTALSDMAAALEMLGEEKASKVTPVFITVDPARDTSDHLKEYVSFFHPRLVGLTGTEDQIKAVVRAYRVYASLNDPSGDDPLDYLVDHTSIIYLVGPDGNLVTHFSHGTTSDAMAERLGQLL